MPNAAARARDLHIAPTDFDPLEVARAYWTDAWQRGLLFLVVLKAGHAYYFIGFPNPVPGQTIEDIARAEAIFLERVMELHPDAEGKPAVIGAIDRISQAVSVAAKRGEHQIQVVTFPCTFCTDGGRRINIADPKWASTLQGFDKNAELRPLGYELYADIISFPRRHAGRRGAVSKVVTAANASSA